MGRPQVALCFHANQGTETLNPEPRQTPRHKGLQRSQASGPGRCMSATDCFSRSLRCTRRSVNASAADCSAENNPAGRSAAAAQAGTRRQKIHSDACTSTRISEAVARAQKRQMQNFVHTHGGKHSIWPFARRVPLPVEFTRAGTDRKSEGAEVPDGRGRRPTT